MQHASTKQIESSATVLSLVTRQKKKDRAQKIVPNWLYYNRTKYDAIKEALSRANLL